MRRQLVMGNLCLIQVQALVISAIAAILSFLLGLVLSPTSSSSSVPRSTSFMEKRQLQKPLAKRDYSKSGIRESVVHFQRRHTPTYTHTDSPCFFLLPWHLRPSVGLFWDHSCVHSSSYVFGCIAILVRLFSTDLPRADTETYFLDNITPPIASCLGDLLTLCIIGLVASLLVSMIDTAVPFILMAALSLATAFAIKMTLRNETVRHLIFLGWTPLLGAMVISSGAGMVLESFVDRYEGFGLLSIVLGGEPFLISWTTNE